MSYWRTPFFRLIFTLGSILTVSSLAFLAIGLQGFQGSKTQTKMQIERHSLAELSLKIRDAVRRNEIELARDWVSRRNGLTRDLVSQRYMQELEQELRRSKPQKKRLLELVNGWQFYQSDEVLRSTDDFQMIFRSLIFQGWVIWLCFIAASAIVMRQIILSMVRPLRYLEEYFRRVHLTNHIAALFSEDSDKREAHIHHASPEIKRLFLGIENLIRQARVSEDRKHSQMIQQKSRAEALAAVSRDAVFLLKEDRIEWANSVGSSLILEEKHFSEFPIEFVEQENGSSSGIMAAIRNSCSRASPFEWKRMSASGETLQYFLLSAIEWDSIRTSESDHFDAVVIAQDVTWIRESEAAKSAFIGLLSHEVKTPVTSLFMATRLLQRSNIGSLTPTQKKLVDSSVRDVERMRELIDEFFSASSFTLSADQMQFRLVDLRRVLGQAIRCLRPEADTRAITMDFVVDSSSSDALIYADAPRVSWAISQVVTQGVRHSPKSSKIVITMSESGRDQSAHFNISVRSPSVFVSESVRDRLFDRNFSRYDLRVARSDATGMSLAIAKEIALGHGGSLAINSEYHDGTEFIFTLPRRQGELGVLSKEERN
ncbi:MAG: hypothetical protein KGQ59_07305 [Bdellovibrionales bacterium]|nr:hypothetical protein [Bdellovibrionales bacterium]